ncbi:TSUP family transporter [Aliiroseovarius sp. KMU-50]|uniref:Probable membrane transporter protein n=1 Tax=Aliiroseovarius salicola TaxID=3009082 RepID=A0ABT4W042_9RHOB|nr:TSUP family transporter [Aliiroseovarius sp. KMU-50]MDA5093877.1 TSUP family transporter [Aliiroseovarius sp. KMU-50]
MPDIFLQALALPGLGWLLAAAFAAGLVRGFTGFGTALIFLPIASQIIDPVAAVAALIVMDIIGPIPALPGAMRDGHPKDMMRLVGGLALVLPVGLVVLFVIDPSVFKLAVSFISLGMVGLLISGFRYHGVLTPKLVWATGGMAGLLGGAAGVPGPPVILLYMASTHPAKVIRANNTAFLFAFDVLMLGGFLGLGRLIGLPLALGVLAILPNLLGNLLGNWLFRPDLTELYRRVAYLIITGSALSGLYSVITG